MRITPVTTAAIPSSLRKPGDIVTLADLRDRFDVPPERVWTVPIPGTATEKDVVYAEEHLDRLCELVDGTLVEKAMGNQESFLAAAIIFVLNTFVIPRKLGFVFAPDSMFRLFPGQIRMPDIAFVSLQRLPLGISDKPIAAIAPDLAVEVLSASNTLKEMNRKRHEYFTAGVRLVWIVDPKTRSITVHTSAEAFQEFTGDQLIDGGNVLPDFTVRVSDIFSGLDLHADE